MAEFSAVTEGAEFEAFAEGHVDDTWDPREVGNEDEIATIVTAAQEKGIITAPTGAELAFEYSPDSEGGGYQWHVMLKRQVTGRNEDGTTFVLRERWLTVVSFWRGMNNISTHEDVRGLAAVREILDEGVNEANSLLADLREWPREEVPA